MTSVEKNKIEIFVLFSQNNFINNFWCDNSLCRIIYSDIPSLKDWIIWFLRKNKISLLMEILQKGMDELITNKIVEIIFVALILVLYAAIFINTQIDDTVFYFSNDYH